MNIQIGSTYSSPDYPKNFTVLGISSQTDTDVKLAVLWVDKTTNQTIPGDLDASLKQVLTWTEVKYDV